MNSLPNLNVKKSRCEHWLRQGANSVNDSEKLIVNASNIRKGNLRSFIEQRNRPLSKIIKEK